MSEKLVFFDCEFTGLIQKTDLISLALIDNENNGLYFEFNDFNENLVNDWLQKNVLENLFFLPFYNYENIDKNEIVYGYQYYDFDEPWQSEIIFKTKNDCAGVFEIINDWLDLYRFDSIQFVSDCCSYDWVLFCQLYEGALSLPERISPYCHDLNQDIANFYNLSDREAFNLDRHDIFSGLKKIDNFNKTINVLSRTLPKHNALWDAYVIKNIWDKISSPNDFDSICRIRSASLSPKSGT